jgi:hypothetical protein
MVNVDTILALSDDALVNQFEIVFPDGIPGGGNGDRISLRSDQQFDIPQQIIYKYDIEFRGHKIPKTGKKEDTEKTITFSIRLDQQWKVYDDLITWLKLAYDPNTGIAVPDLLGRCTIAVHSLNRDNSIAKTITLRNCKAIGIKVTSFDNASGDPQRVELTILFGSIE